MSELIIPDEAIIRKIYLFRSQKVMTDADLAELYGIETRVLNQAVRRNERRFPKDFMFQLNGKEFEQLKMLSDVPGWGGRRSLPYVFTEHGVLMLSSVLNSNKAIDVNVQIVRIFTRMREMILTHKDILLELEELRKTIDGHEERLDKMHAYLLKFMQTDNGKRSEIGYGKNKD